MVVSGLKVYRMELACECERERDRVSIFGETSRIFLLILGSGSLEEFQFCKIVWGFIAKEF